MNKPEFTTTTTSHIFISSFYMCSSKLERIVFDMPRSTPISATALDVLRDTIDGKRENRINV